MVTNEAEKVEQAETGEGTKVFDFATVNRSATARALNINVAHVSRILTGKRVPSFKLAAKMAYYFNISLEQLHDLLYPNAKNPQIAKKDNYYRES